MRWNLQLAVLLGLSLTDVASLAQRPPEDEGLAVTASSFEDSPPPDAGFFDDDGVVHFQLIGGRLCLDAPRHRKGAQHSDQNGVYESIAITAQRGIPSIHYVRRTLHQEITLSVQHAKTVRIESHLTGSQERAVLDQPLLGLPGQNPIRWTIADERQSIKDPTATRHSGATLIHLRHADPDRFDLHFGRLLERLLQGRTLQALSERVDAALIRQLALTPQLNGSPKPRDREWRDGHSRQLSPQRNLAVGMPLKGSDIDTINAAIDQLGSSKLAIRRAAHRTLLSYGAPILPIIKQRSPHEWEAEQLARLRAITASLQPLCDDTPESLATILMNDAEHWLLIASRLQPEQLQLANAHLQQLGMKPLPGRQPQRQYIQPTERIARGGDGQESLVR